MKRYLCTAVVVAAVALSGCAAQRYGYAPVTTTSADLQGASAAVYGIPADAPRGEVRVAMLGVGSSPAVGAQETRQRAVHVALAVSNRADEPWTVDPSEQRLTLTTKRERSEVYATTGDPSRSGPVIVPPRSTRVVDLYFALPIQLQKEDSLPPFDVSWTVHAGARTIAQRTPFQRFLIAPTPEEERDLRRPDDLSEPDPLRREGLPGTERPEKKPFLPFGDPPVE